ncbi:MAG: hypothetical protein LUH10_06805 [Tannerellaceae bacterium]|nr:hypothetical protein [Tannerellaceae bacterium]
MLKRIIYVLMTALIFTACENTREFTEVTGEEHTENEEENVSVQMRFSLNSVDTYSTVGEENKTDEEIGKVDNVDLFFSEKTVNFINL